MNIYVGNVDFKVNEDQLSELFSKYGDVASAKIVTDKFTGRSKGFAFVEMSDDNEAKEAIEALNGYEFNNRALTVNTARPKEENRPFRGGDHGGSRGGYRGGDRDRGDRGGDYGNRGGNRRY
jgi:RNA recognition motif-containing protein